MYTYKEGKERNYFYIYYIYIYYNFLLFIIFPNYYVELLLLH